MTDEVAWVVETQPETAIEWVGSAIDQLDPTRRHALIPTGCGRSRAEDSP